MKTPLMIQPIKDNCKRRITLEHVREIAPEYKTISVKEKRNHKIRDLLSEYFGAYCKKHQVEDYKRGVVNSIISCKTGELGYTLAYCDECKKVDMYACACGNRHCPVCGNLDRRKWTEIQKAEMIRGIPYYHMVFTVPHELTGIIYQNQRPMLDLLFSSVRETLMLLCKNNHNMIPGFLMLLHTFGSNMSLHYHIHVLVAGGGLALNRKSFIIPDNKGFFLPVAVVADIFRGKFMCGFKQLRRNGQLVFLEEQAKYLGHLRWKNLLNICYGNNDKKKHWNVEIRKYNSPETKAGSSESVPSTNTVIEYFANYTNRTAISEERIISYDENNVIFKYKKYNGPKYMKEEMTLSIDEFIRRFLLHILPKGFQKIRSGGFLAGSVRQKNLELINKLLGRDYSPSPVRDMKGIELVKYFYGKDLTKCSKCKKTVEILSVSNDWESSVSIRDA